MTVFEAKREDTGELVEFEDDPEQVVGFGAQVTLELGGAAVVCTRVFSRIQPPRRTSNMGRNSDNGWRAERTDGRFTSMQLPTLEQVELSERDPDRPSIPRAPHYDRQDNASFMNKGQARDYAKRLAGVESDDGEYVYQD